MSNVKPAYIVALIAVLLLVIFIKVTNPHRKYSTREFWENASLESISMIPDEAIKPGNRNGPVLMWAAIGTKDPSVLSALVERGADINESDGIFEGTPLTGAAGYSKNVAVIDELIRLGADIKKEVHNGEDALMIAAQYNKTPGIIERLVYHGADVTNRNKHGKSALDLAEKMKNQVAIDSLNKIIKEAN